ASPSGRKEKSSAVGSSPARQRSSATKLSASAHVSSGRRSMKSLGPIHLLPEAERTHVRPDLFDVRQAFVLGPLPARVLPARRILPVREPDRVLHLVVHDDLVLRRILTRHRSSKLLGSARGARVLSSPQPTKRPGRSVQQTSPGKIGPLAGCNS